MNDMMALAVPSSSAVLKKQTYPRPGLKNKSDQNWWKRYSQLEDIWLAGGNPNISFLQKELGPWLRRQIDLGNRNMLNPERREALNHLAIVWLRKRVRAVRYVVKARKLEARAEALKKEKERQNFPLHLRKIFPRPPMSRDQEVLEWWWMFGRLEKLWLEGGDAFKPMDKVLREWLSLQRLHQQQGLLSKARLKALRHIQALPMPDA